MGDKEEEEHGRELVTSESSDDGEVAR